MRRREFLVGCAAGTMIGSTASMGANLSPTDLRPAKPIGLARPSRPVTRSGVATLRVEDARSVKILQLTDLHFFCDREKQGEKADRQTQELIARLVERHQPDLVAYSGDVWHDPPKGQSAEIFDYALEAMSKPGVPWLFTWGNHDLLEDVAGAQVALTEAAGSLYRGAYSTGNYRVALEGGGGERLFDLLCLNTTTQGVQRDQETWLETQLSVDTKQESSSQALCFLHIPLLQYAEVWDRGEARGTKQEAVCTYGEDGSALPLLKRLGVLACFCGHDHVNDYAGRIDGVEMVYGRASGHAGYGGEQLAKGGKLITLNAENGTFAWKTVFPDGATWRP